MVQRSINRCHSLSSIVSSFISAVTVLLTTCSAPYAAGDSSTEQPPSFVYLRDIDPTILQDIKYATRDNFTGEIVPGYEAGECLLVRPAAEALARVQAELRKWSLSLKVYDCFRPERAVGAFVTWSQLRSSQGATKRFYPRVAKEKLLALGYIAQRSGHSRGTAVDASLVKVPPPASRPFDRSAKYGSCNGPVASRAPDNSIDMGTGFDCFDPLSHTGSELLNPEQRKWRDFFVDVMGHYGFRNYAREWWHFSFQDADDAQPFDFPIRPKGREPAAQPNEAPTR